MLMFLEIPVRAALRGDTRPGRARLTLSRPIIALSAAAFAFRVALALSP